MLCVLQRAQSTAAILMILAAVAVWTVARCNCLCLCNSPVKTSCGGWQERALVVIVSVHVHDAVAILTQAMDKGRGGEEKGIALPIAHGLREAGLARWTDQQRCVELL